jgi:hypothetical protein
VLSDAARAFWSSPGRMTSLAGVNVGALPDDPAELRELVPRLIVHPAWAAAYGVTIDAEREAENNLRAAGDIAAALGEHVDAPLTTPRLPADRVAGTCRNFTVFYVALLRHVGIPARARCGHAGYFEAGKWVDHWVAEWWSDAEDRWRRADAQLDEFQLQVIGVDWSPDDLPEGVFLSGGECWAAIRNGNIDPSRCGIFDMWGTWFVRSNAARDLAALNKVELLPWDAWGIALDQAPIGSDADNAVFDELAVVCAGDDLTRIQACYADARFTVPPTITSFGPAGPVTVTL